MILRTMVGVLALALPALPAHAQTTLDRPSSPGVREVVDAIIEISPVVLPEDMWAPYSMCLIDSLMRDLVDSEVEATLLLIDYIMNFDRPGTSMSGQTAARINNEAVVPCLSLNPIYAIDEGLIGMSTLGTLQLSP